MTPVTAITAAPLDAAALIRAVAMEGTAVGSAAADGAKADGSPGTGAVAAFIGVVRDHNLGRRVLHLEYEAYEPLALRGLDLIVEEARERWPAVRLMVHHRIGRLAIGEASVAIAAASPHRADAFSAARYAIERIKQIVPIWKHEYFEGGDVWIEGATADPDNADAREKAMKIACA